MKVFSLCSLLCLLGLTLSAQTTSDCALDFGTNMSGLADFGTELPFVNLMRNARTWYTKDQGNPDAPFDSGHFSALTYRADGYPTHIPQDIDDSDYAQEVATIWANTSGWPAGQYTILWEGTGELVFWGTYDNLDRTSEHRALFDLSTPADGALEIRIAQSERSDPIHNIRVLMPGTEQTYLTQPFYEPWVERLRDFPSVRFMDWGQTNNWGEGEEGWQQPNLFTWEERSQMDHYTWAYEKGVPYEMMIKLLNDYDLDGWVCVPHRADNNYIRQMARLFKDQLEPDRHLTVEYSNEIWNWIFGQTHWLNQYGCIETGTPWPEGVAPYVQNCLDIWTEVYAGDLSRITRTVGAFTGWTDISKRIVENLRPGSFDGLAATYYFGFTDAGEADLDRLGDQATVEDVATFARDGMAEALMYIREHQEQLVEPLGIRLNFYEGGQHLTPYPFGAEPSYARALLDIQRDPLMYDLYQEWFADLETLHSGGEPLQLMNFSFIGGRSARYGSWGILESIHQDTDLIPAPKYQALMDYMGNCELSVSTTSVEQSPIAIFPNPTNDLLSISGLGKHQEITLFNALGQPLRTYADLEDSATISIGDLPAGTYFIAVDGHNNWVPLVKW